MKMTTLLLVWVVLSGRTGFAQSSSTEKTLRAYYAAFETKDWNSMASLLADGFTFSSPLDDHISVAVFKEKCWPNAYKIKRIDVDKMVIHGDDAVVITNGWTNEGKLFRNSDYFRLKNGKIASYECFFGPGVNYPSSGK